MELVLNGIGDWIEKLFSYSTEFSIVVGDLHLRLEELVEQDLSLEVNYSCPSKLEAGLGKHHLAVDY